LTLHAGLKRFHLARLLAEACSYVYQTLHKEKHMSTKTIQAPTGLAMFALMFAVTACAADKPEALPGQTALFLTQTNASPNFLAVINTVTKETNYVPTGGKGGASGNAGGVAVSGELAAAVNFGSLTVTIFERVGNAMHATQLVKTTSAPLSVAFGHEHLFVLGATTAESFPIFGNTIGASDGSANLLIGDGSSAQIISYANGAVYSEKTGSIGLLPLTAAGAISGQSTPVELPAAPNNNTPFGMVADGPNVYATIAHSDLETLIVNGQIISTAVGPTPFTNSEGAIIHAPCWNALRGHFLFSSDSPGKQLLRYLVSDSNVYLDKVGVAALAGAPTDLDIKDNLLGVIDGGNGVNSDVTLFEVTYEGELTMRFSLPIAGAINGAAIIQ
jgi:hypothetical protein